MHKITYTCPGACILLYISPFCFVGCMYGIMDTETRDQKKRKKGAATVERTDILTFSPWLSWNKGVAMPSPVEWDFLLLVVIMIFLCFLLAFLFTHSLREGWGCIYKSHSYPSSIIHETNLGIFYYYFINCTCRFCFNFTFFKDLSPYICNESPPLNA